MKRRRITTRRLAGIAALTAVTLFAVTACSGSAAGGDSSEKGDKLNVLLGAVFSEAAYIAQEEGFFADENLDVTLMEGGAAAEQIPQLLNGQADVAITGGTSLINAVDQGLPVKMVLGQQNAGEGFVSAGLLARPDSGITSYADLEGKTIALQGLNETTHLATMLAVEQAGGDPKSIDFVQLPLPNIVDAIQNGDVDAGFPLSIFYTAGVEAGLTEIGAATSDAIPNGPNVVWASTDSYIAEHADVLERFAAAMKKAVDLAMSDDERLRTVQKEHSELPAEYIDAVPVTQITTMINRSGVQRTLDGMTEFGFIDKKLTVDDVVASLAPTEG